MALKVDGQVSICNANRDDPAGEQGSGWRGDDSPVAMLDRRLIDSMDDILLRREARHYGWLRRVPEASACP